MQVDESVDIGWDDGARNTWSSATMIHVATLGSDFDGTGMGTWGQWWWDGTLDKLECCRACSCLGTES